MSTPADRQNPFQPPRAVLDSAPPAAGELVPDGQRVPAGRGGTWLADGWRLLRKAHRVWLGMTIVFVVMWMVLAIIPLGGLVTNVLFPVMVGGIMMGCRDLEEGKPLQFASLFSGFSTHAGPLLIVGLLYLVGAVAIGLVIGVGVFAAMIPTISTASSGNARDMLAVLPIIALAVLVGMALMLPLVMAVWFAPALVVFHDMPATTAMKTSFAGCLRNIVPFLVYGIVGFFLMILATIPLGFGWLVLIPVLWGSAYAGYRDIFIRPA